MLTAIASISGQSLLQALDDAMLDPPCGEPDCVTDRDARARAVRDDDEAAEPEKIGAAIGLRVEASPDLPRRATDEQATEASPYRCAQLHAQRVEQREDRPL